MQELIKQKTTKLLKILATPPIAAHFHHNDIVPFGTFNREDNRWEWFGGELENAHEGDLDRILKHLNAHPIR